MKTKYLFLAALAGMTLVGCTSDDFIAEAPPVDNNEAMTPIVFSSLKSNFTRADDFVGAKAADMLGNMFVVFGYKGTKTATPGSTSTVFDNYFVQYKENTANTTESNSSNWEYVLEDADVADYTIPIKHAKDKGIVAQTIKYWDYSQPQYDFFAWSAGSKKAIFEGTPAAGQVLVSKMSAADLSKAYTFEGKAADLSQVFISDLVTVKKDGSTAGKYGETVGYKEHPVTLKFRQLGTKVRIGIYETIPGYSVRDVKFYTKDGKLDATTAGGDTTPGVVAPGQIVNNATLFSAGADIYTEGTYTVSFPTVDTPDDADNNQAHITFAAKSGVDQTTIVDWGALNYTIAEKGEKTPGNVYLGRTSNTATFAGDADANYYEVYLPNSDGANLNLRVDFTMESIDGGGEVIEVKNAKAQVPSIYTQWKPGFAYTYLFKISDKTNGRTGVYDPTQNDDATVNSDPAGLYPITFDAVVVNAEDNDKTQETITTVMTPSITTYQQNSTVVNDDEYSVNDNDIFVTVNEGDALVTFTNETSVEDKDVALYTIPAGKTEAEVVDALQMQDDIADANTIKGRSGLVLHEAGFTLTNSVEFGADGNAISVGDNQAVRFTPTENTTYAFVYTKKAATNRNPMYSPIQFNDSKVAQKYRYAYTTPESTDAQKGVKYFSKDASNVYTMVPQPFIGQGVGNLYTKEGNVYKRASGYAVTGTTYYYTIDNGVSYNLTVPINYAYFGDANTTDIYTFDGKTNQYVVKPSRETEPRDGIAYYKKVTDSNTGGEAYAYCIILPQQTTGWFELDTNTFVEVDETAAVVGQTYFDKYIKNNGEYYTKVIKVQ